VLAEGLGALKTCKLCRIEVVVPEVLEEAVCDYYGTPALDRQMSDEIRQSGVLVPDAMMNNICTVCAESIFAMPA